MGVGAYINPSVYAGSLTLSQAITAWETNSGRRMAVQRMYVGKNVMPVNASDTGLASKGFLAALAANRRVLFAYKPSFFGAPPPLGGGTSQAALDSNVNGFFTSCVSAGFTSDTLIVDLWQEPYFSGITGAAGVASSSDFIAMFQHYAPIIRSYGFQVVFCTSTSAVIGHNENSYYPGDASCDAVVTDYYASQYVAGDRFGGGNVNTDAAYHADNAVPPKPFGLYEIGTSLDTTSGQSQANATAYFNYLNTYMSGRLTSGKANADVAFFNSSGNAVAETPIITPDGQTSSFSTTPEYRNVLYDQLFDALTPANNWSLVQKSASQATTASGKTVTGTLPAASSGTGNVPTLVLAYLTGGNGTWTAPSGWTVLPAAAGSNSAAIMYYVDTGATHVGTTTSFTFSATAGLKCYMAEYNPGGSGLTIFLNHSGTGTSGAATSLTVTALDASAGDLVAANFQEIFEVSSGYDQQWFDATYSGWQTLQTAGYVPVMMAYGHAWTSAQIATLPAGCILMPLYDSLTAQGSPGGSTALACTVIDVETGDLTSASDIATWIKGRNALPGGYAANRPTVYLNVNGLYYVGAANDVITPLLNTYGLAPGRDYDIWGSHLTNTLPSSPQSTTVGSFTVAWVATQWSNYNAAPAPFPSGSYNVNQAWDQTWFNAFAPNMTWTTPSGYTTLASDGAASKTQHQYCGHKLSATAGSQSVQGKSSIRTSSTSGWAGVVGVFTATGTSGNVVTITNPGNQVGIVGTPVSLQLSGTDSAPGQTLTYSATGLPTGLSISSLSVDWGAFLNQGDLNTTSLSAAVSAWTAIVDRPFLSTNFYLFSTPANLAANADLQYCATNGIAVYITMDALPFNPPTSAAASALGTFLSSCKAGGLQAQIAIFGEPSFHGGGLTNTLFLAAAAFYGPTIRTYYPFAFWCSANALATNNEATFYKSGQFDSVLTDIYAARYLSGVTLDQAAALADGDGIPFGIAEHNSALLGGGNWLVGDNTTFDATNGTWTGAGNCTATQTTAQSHTGTGSLAITCNVTGPANAVAASNAAANILTQGLPCSPGDVIQVTFWVRSNGTSRTIHPGAGFYDSTGTAIGGTTFATASVTDTTTWQQLTGTVTAPASAAFCRGAVQVLSTVNAEIHFVDDVFLTNNNVGQNQSDATSFFNYVRNYMTTRLSAGKKNLSAHFFSSDSQTPVNNLTNAIRSSSDYRTGLFQQEYDTTASAGQITGTPTAAGTYSVLAKATDTTNTAGTTAFTWTISPASGNTITVTNPGNQASVVGTFSVLTIQATDSAAGQTLTYAASGLPAGLTINATSGVISGTPGTAATYSVTVTVTDTTLAAGSATFLWTVNPAGTGGGGTGSNTGTITIDLGIMRDLMGVSPLTGTPGPGIANFTRLGISGSNPSFLPGTITEQVVMPVNGYYPGNMTIDGSLTVTGTINGTQGSGGGGGGTSTTSIVWQPASGDTTGATDWGVITTALNAAGTATPFQPVYLGPFTYYINHPLIIPPGVSLIGTFANEVAEVTGGGIQSGTVILGSTTFTQGTAHGNAMILIQDSTDGGYSVTSEEQKLYGIVLDGGNIPGSVVNDGIQMLGGISRPHLERVAVQHMNGNGINFVTGADNGQPGHVRFDRVTARYSGLTGFVLYRSSDSTYRDCLAENNTGDGYVITNASNGLFYGCRSEHNNNGYTFISQNEATGSGGAKFVGCSTDRNQQYGFQFITQNNTGTPVTMSGCVARRDGRNADAGGGGFAGIYVTGYPSAILLSGCQVFPGVNDDGTGQNSPQIGVKIASNAGGWVGIGSGCYVQGATTPVQDDLTGTTVYANDVLTAHGTTATAVGLQIRGGQSGGLLYMGNGGTITTTMINNISAAGYTGIYLDPRFVWDMSGVVFNAIQDFAIESRMDGSIGWTGNINYNTSGYIKTDTGNPVNGVQVYASTPGGTTQTQGVIFRNCTFVGANSHAVIHYGGGQRRCGLVNCLVYNTSSATGAYAVVVGSGLSDNNSENMIFEFGGGGGLAGNYGALGIGVYDQTQHANDTLWSGLSTSAGVYSIVHNNGGGHLFNNFYDRSSPTSANVNSTGGGRLLFHGSEFQNGSGPAFTISGGVVVLNGCTVTNNGSATTIVQTGGTLIFRDYVAFNAAQTMTLNGGSADFTDAGLVGTNLSITGSSGTLVLLTSYPGNGAAPTHTGFTGTVSTIA